MFFATKTAKSVFASLAATAFLVFAAPVDAAKVSTRNTAPLIYGTPATSVKAGSNYSFVPTAVDAEGNALTFRISGKPVWAAFSSSNGALTGTPAAANAGTYANIIISVSDGKLSRSLKAFSITVTAPANTAPVISGTPVKTATVGVAYAFQPTASDANGDTLSFSATGLPAWLTFSSSTGRVSGTPPTGSAGTYGPIVISVCDGKATTSLAGFTITVANPPNTAPTISGAPVTTATVGVAYAFQPTASDANGDTLSFTATGLPAWLVLTGSTGRLSGTPPTGSAGTYGPIVLTVSDGKATASLAGFTITVSNPPNGTPTISGTPATSATVGQAYTFQATASDPDGQTLRFGIANKPAWASFDVVTGILSGTPTQADVGTYANIVVSVSDGVASATLAPFTITVAAPVTGTAELTWSAPTQNEDGSALTNLAGYKIRYGNSPGNLDQVVTVASPAITSAAIEGLTAGTWYFTVASYTNTGTESAQTGAVYKTVM